ncbi:GGDEF domain-containing phosphodiesterase [Parvularcula sp. IMCC14364]|uniref:GGDEF domain-containing phosphodiesterase n=1 Tax=Parvularcula sp. IMCC14364 TaxID=3067902 RepID=UPI002741FCE6|nr:GGDEF domain-containing phosphodiesterase [Parvularcula sp. IMCC14364]
MADLVTMIFSAGLLALTLHPFVLGFAGYALLRLIINKRRQPHPLENYAAAMIDASAFVIIAMIANESSFFLAMSGMFAMILTRSLWLDRKMIYSVSIISVAGFAMIGIVAGQTVQTFSLLIISMAIVAGYYIYSRALTCNVTGLKSMAWFALRSQERIGCSWRDRDNCPMNSYGIFLVQLENHAELTEAFGLGVADNCMAQISDTVSQMVCKWGYVSKFDESTIIVLDANFNTDKDVKNKAYEILTVLETSLNAKFKATGIKLRVGGALETGRHKNSSEVISDAHLALRAAKNHNVPAIMLDQPLRNLMAQNLQLERDLHHAVENDEFALVFQPIINGVTGDIDGAEALLRWPRDEKIMSPAVFIEVAEKSGLIVEIGAWVVKTAVRDWKKIRENSGLNQGWVSVNVAIQQLQEWDTLYAATQKAVEGGVPLKLEITESATSEECGDIADKISRLRALGVKIAIDDFGTGFSSLSRLHELQADSLKIDRSFVEQMHTGRGVSTIKSISALAQAHQMAVIVEGIETDEQRLVLSGLGLRIHQGYFYSKPLIAEELVHFLDLWQRYHCNYDEQVKCPTHLESSEIPNHTGVVGKHSGEV